MINFLTAMTRLTMASNTPLRRMFMIALTASIDDDSGGGLFKPMSSYDSDRVAAAGDPPLTTDFGRLKTNGKYIERTFLSVNVS